VLNIVEWEDRAKPTHAFWSDTVLGAGCHGVPWEIVLLAANQLNKDVWINVPATASAPGGPDVTGPRTPKDHTKTYVYELAKLFRDGNEFTGNVGLNKGLKIYIEHSNEVWNFGFRQYGINKAAAVAEVNYTKGESNLVLDVGTGKRWTQCSYDPALKNQECWAHRRHARRLWEITAVFEEVFGPGSINKKVLPVYASWTINLEEYYNHTLTWLAKAQGAKVNTKFYALATTGYFGPEAQDAAGHKQPYDFEKHSVPEIAQAFLDGATANRYIVGNFSVLKNALGLKYAAYEAGPGAKVGGLKPGSVGLNHLIGANRHPTMGLAVKQDVKETFFGRM